MADLERADEIMAAVIEARGDAQIARVREAIAQTLADERAKVRAPFVELARDYDDGSEWGTALYHGYKIREAILRAAGVNQ